MAGRYAYAIEVYGQLHIKASHSASNNVQIKRIQSFGLSRYLLFKCYLLFEHGTELKTLARRTRVTQ